ncbi:MAG: MarR family transcriptional regulator [Methanobacteriota archaeon]
MKNITGLRLVGMMVAIVAVIMAFLLISYVDTLTKMSQESCTCGDVCGMVSYETPPLVYVGLAAVAILFFLGIVIIVKGQSLAGTVDSRSSWTENLEKLKESEKDVYSLLMESGGTMFQGEVVEKSGLSKVKVSRTLDKLESRRLVERRRRGLTNIIVLKDL